MDSLVEKLKKTTDYIGGDGRTEEQISAAEKELKLVFSSEYRSYLKEIGLCVFEYHELTGISDEFRNNVVDVTRNQWKFNEMIPHNMYVVEDTGMDHIVIWQDEMGKVYKAGYKEAPIMIAESMEDYYKL